MSLKPAWAGFFIPNFYPESLSDTNGFYFSKADLIRGILISKGVITVFYISIA